MAGSGLDRVIALTLNLIAGKIGATVSNIPAIITDEAPSGSGDFGAGYAKKYKVNQLAAVATDFSDSGLTYDAAVAIASQTPKVNEFYVIKRASAVAAVVTLVFSANIVTGNTIAGTVNGNAISVPYNTSNAQSLTDLATAIQALEMVATAVSNGSTTITITFESEWEPSVSTFTVTGGSSQATCTTTVTTPATNIVDDIANAVNEDATFEWFVLLPTTVNKGAILAAAAATESYGGQFMTLFHTTEAAVITSASTDVASLLQDEAYNYSGIIYHDDQNEMVHAAWASDVLSTDPGAVSFALKSLEGVTSSGLSAAQIGYVEGKNCNSYTDAGPGPLTLKGVNCAGISLEAMRDSLYAKAELETALYNLMTTRRKIPYNEAGFGLVQSYADSVTKRMISEGVFDPEADPINQFIMPAVADVALADKNNRIIPDCQWNATHLASGIKIEITSNISVV